MNRVHQLIDLVERRPRLAIASILVLSLLMRAIVYVKLSHSDFYAASISVLGGVGEGFADGHPLKYNVTRQQTIHHLQIASGGLIDPADVARDDQPQNWSYDTKREPGYGILLGLLWKFAAPGRYIAVMILQNIIGIALAFWLYFELLALVPRWVAIASLGGLLLFPPSVRFDNQAYTYCWLNYACLATAALMARLQSERKSHRLASFGFGILLGLCYWIRSVVFPLAGVTVLAAYYLRGRRIAAEVTAAMILALAIVLAPMPFVSLKIYKSWKPLRLTFWHTVWNGFGQAPNDFGAQWSDAATKAMVIRERPDVAPFSVEYEAHLKKRSLEIIRTRPDFLARLALQRMIMLTRADWNPFNQLPLKVPARLVAIWTLIWIALSFALKPVSSELRLVRGLALIAAYIIVFHFFMAVETYYIWPAQALSVVGLILLAPRWIAKSESHV